MPYIKQELRPFIRPLIQANDVGELNYAITALCQNYIDGKGLRYQTINDIVGALEGAKLEFYARVARPYEDQKMFENGDVYDAHNN